MMPDFERFVLRREEDATGVSGTGDVAEGVQFTSGWCAMTWRSDLTSITFYADIETVEAIHGHDGRTQVVWLEATGAELSPERESVV